MGEGNAKELPGLKISVPVVPGLSAEIPIRASLLRPLTRHFRPTPTEQLVQVVAAGAFVHIHADDEGTVEASLLVVNLTDRPLRVDDLHLELFYIDHYATGVAQPLFKAPDRPIPPFYRAEVRLSINLTTASIRQILQRMQRAQNACSSPRLELTVGGKLDLYIPGSWAALQRAKAIRLPFQLDVRPTEFNISCPSSRG